MKVAMLPSLAALPASCSNHTATPKKTNVIIILADDLGYGDLECYGAKNVKTENVNVLRHKRRPRP